MAAPRLPFLWPFLFKQSSVGGATRASRRAISQSTKPRQQVTPHRYGTANEPPPHIRQVLPQEAKEPRSKEPKGGREPKAAKTSEAAFRTSNKSGSKKDSVAKEETLAATGPESSDVVAAPPKDDADPIKDAPAVLAIDPANPATSTSDSKLAAKNKSANKSPDPQSQHRALLGPDSQPPPTPIPRGPLLPSVNPLETVLNMPSSDKLGAAQIPAQPPYYHENDTAADPSEHRPPHINTPRYVHHFDTYSLVKSLEEHGWRNDQAVTVMKAVRLILADNMDLARDGLVSKSNVENETYLFRAACSELRTEVEMRRKAETEKTRTERTSLQHEVDILGQRLGMDVAGLKEELKGMVEGRKMEVRDEGRTVESKLQEINYRITVALNSDSRSDVEGIRWIITKRSITALAVCVLMVLFSLKYTSGVLQQEEEARKKQKAAAAAFRDGNSAGLSGVAAGDAHMRDMDRIGERLGEVVVTQGGDASFVSLG